MITDVCLSPFVVSGHANHYKVVYCLLQKIYRQPLKKVTYLATIRPTFLAQSHGHGHGQGLGWQGQSHSKAKGVCFKAKDKKFGLTFLTFIYHFFIYL